MIFTSYFGGLRKYADILVKEQIVPISIALYKPSWYRGLEYPALAPTEAILNDYKNGSGPYIEKTKRYVDAYRRDVLGQTGLTPEKVVQDLYALAGRRNNVALLCYEAPADFCHRHIVSDWLRSAGFEVAELSKDIFNEGGDSSNVSHRRKSTQF